MMDFIMVPLIFGIVTYGIYSLFELFVHKKERLMIIEKLSEKVDWAILQCFENRMSDGWLRLRIIDRLHFPYVCACEFRRRLENDFYGVWSVGFVVRWFRIDLGIYYREQNGKKE